jgi:hypothetical protein
MLLSSFFIIDANEIDKLPAIQLPENAYLVYRTSINNLSDKSFYKKVFNAPQKYPFCLMADTALDINGPEKESKEALEALVAFTFHFNYIRLNYGNPLIIFETNIADTHDYINSIVNGFHSFGYDGVEIMYKQHENIISWHNKEKTGFYYNLINNADINTLSDTIKKTSATCSAIFYKVSSPEKLYEIIRLIQDADQKILDQFPELYKALQRNNTLAANEQELKIKFGLWKEKLESQTMYNSLYKQSDERYHKQMKEVVDFYKKEYEILPLWFKQLGHIIKVITGKRTFRSLFDDNVKKYKV